jgi:hypothetical protein
MSHARRLVARDKARYDAMWAAVSADPVNRVWLVALQAEVARIQAMLPAGPPRQFNRRQQQRSAPVSHSTSQVQWLTTSMPNRKLRTTVSSFSAAFVLNRTSIGRVRRQEGLDSLDQLYVQATCLHPVLLERVQAWAAASGGLFSAAASLAGRGGPLAFVRWADVQDGEGVEIKWCCVKGVQRAVERVVRSYRQVSQATPYLV